MKGLMDQLHTLGKPYDNDMAVNLINRSLNKDFGDFVRNFNMHCVGKTVTELHALLIDFEKGLKDKAPTPQVFTIQKGRDNKPKPQGVTRRSERTKRAPNRLCLNMEVEDDEVGDLGEPANYKTAMLDPDKVIWQGAMDEEMKSMKVNKRSECNSPALLKPSSSVAKGLHSIPMGLLRGNDFSPGADIRFSKPDVAVCQNLGQSISNRIQESSIGLAVKHSKVNLWTKGSGFKLTCFSDADHAGCIDTRKSTSGGIQFLGDKLVSWMSKKQDCTAMSSVEAEYVALSASCAQVMWMRIQLQDYGFNYNKIPLYCDSQSAIAISCNPVQHSQTKHIHTRYHFIKEQVENGIIELYFVRTEYQLADMFTKALPEDRFKYLVRRIGMRCLTPADLEVLTNETA
ncbi:hypothetical protein Tco_0566178 [Tanacetum coccineum]